MAPLAGKVRKPMLTLEWKKVRLSADQKDAVKRFLSLDEKNRHRMLELVELYQTSDDPKERVEICLVMAEVLFPCKNDLRAVPFEASPSGKKKLAAHRRHVADNMKRLRNKRGMTQQQLAEASGLHQSHISRLENGDHAATYKTIKMIARGLHVRPEKVR